MMVDESHENRTYTRIDYSEKKMPAGIYDNCVFVNCNFSKSDLSYIDFVDCTFKDCDFSMVKFNDTALKNATFSACKMLGVDFTKCRDFLLSFYFEKCTLDYSSFQNKKVKKTIFKECSVKEVDFSAADLSASDFLSCDLSRAVFRNTILEKVDFRSARNYSIDLEKNRIQKAKFSSAGIIGLLDKYKIIIE